LTERHRTGAELRETNRRLEEALEALQAQGEEVRTMSQQLWQATKLATVGELAAGIAHELNNPLATVSLRVEALLAALPADSPHRRPLAVSRPRSSAWPTSSPTCSSSAAGPGTRFRRSTSARRSSGRWS